MTREKNLKPFDLFNILGFQNIRATEKQIKFNSLRDWSLCAFLSLAALTSTAHGGNPNCINALKARVHQNLVEAAASRPQRKPITFADTIADASNSLPFRKAGPRALEDMNPNGAKFIGSQASFAEETSMVKLSEIGTQVPVMVEAYHKGRKIKIVAYLTLPFPISGPTNSSDKHYLIGPEYKDTGVVIWFHGGGTRTATGSNGLSVGAEVGKRGSANLSFDLNGHANSSLQPFLGTSDELQLYAELAKKYIHPSVPVTIAGHSRGGQMALQLWLDLPKLDFGRLRIVNVISLSPPADLTGGKSLSERNAAEEKVQRCMVEWLKDVAPQDLQFVTNIIETGKTAPGGPTLNCIIGNSDYLFKKPNDGYQRPPIKVYVGGRDGLVFVGREQLYIEHISAVVGRENLIILPDGYGVKSGGDKTKIIPTGHNVYDLYLWPEKRAELAEFLGVDKDREDLAAIYTLISHSIQQAIGSPFPFLSITRNNSTIEGLLDLYYRYYANDLAFQEFVEKDFEQILVRSPELKFRLELNNLLLRVKENHAKFLAMQLKNLEDAYREREVQMVQAFDPAVRSADALEKQVALAKPMSEAQLAQLKRAYEVSQKIEDRLTSQGTTQDAIHKQLLSEIKWPENINSIEAAKERIREIQLELAKKPRSDLTYDEVREQNKAQSKLKSELTNLNRVVTEVAQAKTKSGKLYFEQLQAAFDAAMASGQITLPEGIDNPRNLRSAYMADRDPVRYSRLIKTLEEIKSERAKFEQQRQALTQTSVIGETGRISQNQAATPAFDFFKELLSGLGLLKPEDQAKLAPTPADRERLIGLLKTFRGIDDIEKYLKTTEEINNFRYIPENSTRKGRIKDLISEIATKAKTLGELDRQINDLVKKLNETYKTQRTAAKDSLDESIRAISPPELESFQQRRNEALRLYSEAQIKSDTFASNRITEAYDGNYLDEKFIRQIQVDMTPYAREYLAAKARFDRIDKVYQAQKYKLAASGAFGPEVLKQYQKYQSHDQRVRDAIKERETLLESQARVEFELDHAKAQYINLVPGYITAHQASISRILNQPYSQLVQFINEDPNGSNTIEVLKKAFNRYALMRDRRDRPEKRGAEIN